MLVSKKAPERHSIIFTDMDSMIICHEVGHNYGLYPSASYHCPNSIFCIMTSPWNPILTDFCDTCENYIDKDKYGPPPRETDFLEFIFIIEGNIVIIK